MNSFEQLRPLNKIETRIHDEERMGRNLMDYEKSVTGVYPYADPYQFELRNLDEIQDLRLRGEVEALIMFISVPIITDNIENNTEGVVNNKPRKDIGLDLTLHKPDLYQFYESNKLQKSNFGNILGTIDEIDQLYPLSADLKKRRDELYTEFIGELPDYRPTRTRYSYALTNDERRELAEKATRFAEDVILEIFARERNKLP